MTSIVVMGVAGCGKSSLGKAMADALGLRFIEGDAFHSPASIAKMRAAIALTDEDRRDWLATLAAQLAAAPEGVVLACSALKWAYREQLRAASPALRFVFIEISRELALERVAGRGDSHLFPVALVDSQFAALEPPRGEPGVLRVAAEDAAELQLSQALRWLEGKS